MISINDTEWIIFRVADSVWRSSGGEIKPTGEEIYITVLMTTLLD